MSKTNETTNNILADYPPGYPSWTPAEKTRFSRELTTKTTNAILKFFFNAGIYSYRQNSSGIPLPGGGFRPAAKTGLPDVVAILPPTGRHCGIEIKTGNDRLRPEQFGTLENIKRMGGFALVVKDFEDFLIQWETINK